MANAVLALIGIKGGAGSSEASQPQPVPPVAVPAEASAPPAKPDLVFRRVRSLQINKAFGPQARFLTIHEVDYDPYQAIPLPRRAKQRFLAYFDEEGKHAYHLGQDLALKITVGAEWDDTAVADLGRIRANLLSQYGSDFQETSTLDTDVLAEFEESMLRDLNGTAKESDMALAVMTIQSPSLLLQLAFDGALDDPNYTPLFSAEFMAQYLGKIFETSPETAFALRWRHHHSMHKIVPTLNAWVRQFNLLVNEHRLAPEETPPLDALALRYAEAIEKLNGLMKTIARLKPSEARTQTLMVIEQSRSELKLELMNLDEKVATLHQYHRVWLAQFSRPNATAAPEASADFGFAPETSLNLPAWRERLIQIANTSSTFASVLAQLDFAAVDAQIKLVRPDSEPAQDPLLLVIDTSLATSEPCTVSLVQTPKAETQ